MQEFEITLETAPEKTELVLIPEQTKLEQIAKPVSYTHLTLPTNSLV